MHRTSLMVREKKLPIDVTFCALGTFEEIKLESDESFGESNIDVFIQ